jgi:predicted enzyme related to lactoylglutathione lyase
MAKVIHFELMGDDGDGLTKFYEGLFGWKTQAVEGYDGYNFVSTDDAGVGGAIGRGPEEARSYLSVYFQVESIDQTLEQAELAGAKTLVPRTVLPGIVTYGMFADPAGNMIGLTEPAEAVPGN